MIYQITLTRGKDRPVNLQYLTGRDVDENLRSHETERFNCYATRPVIKDRDGITFRLAGVHGTERFPAVDHFYPWHRVLSITTYSGRH